MAMSPSEYKHSGAAFLARKYGLKKSEAEKLATSPLQHQIVADHERWRERHGWPAADSPLSRGKLLKSL